jgi:chloramphenicol O-acetyltransferase type A
VFGFCDVPFVAEFPEFAERAAQAIAELRVRSDVLRDMDRDDVLYMSPIPWVSFTAFNHPMRLHPSDSVPRFAWGKLFRDGDTLKMPLNVQGHHAIMDGLHMGRFYAKVEEYLLAPDLELGAG